MGGSFVSLETYKKALSLQIAGIVVGGFNYYDLEEILSSVVNNPVTPAQQTFIKEFATLIKNLFDSEINTLNK